MSACLVGVIGSTVIAGVTAAVVPAEVSDVSRGTPQIFFGRPTGLFTAGVGLKLVKNCGHSAAIVSGMLELSLPPILFPHERAEIRKL